jgi:transcriptional regulator with XRE-family HTH domain
MNLGESIKNIRQAKGLSQGEMQKRTGILRSYLSRVENGHTVPSLATLQRLASAMGVALSDFFAANGQPTEGAPAAAMAASASDPANQYLAELKTLLPQLTSQQRDQLLDMVKDMASTLKR